MKSTDVIVFRHFSKRIYRDLWYPVANVRNDHGKDALQLTPRMAAHAIRSCLCMFRKGPTVFPHPPKTLSKMGTGRHKAIQRTPLAPDWLHNGSPCRPRCVKARPKAPKGSQRKPHGPQSAPEAPQTHQQIKPWAHPAQPETHKVAQGVIPGIILVSLGTHVCAFL